MMKNGQKYESLKEIKEIMDHYGVTEYTIGPSSDKDAEAKIQQERK